MYVWLMPINLFVAATLYFDQRTYTINEANEAVQPVLRLSDPLLQDITVQVYSNKGSATGLCSIVLCKCYYKIL